MSHTLRTQTCPQCGEVVGHVSSFGNTSPCRLHQAAPALVAALELIERSTQFNGGTFPAELQQIARAALALAKGE